MVYPDAPRGFYPDDAHAIGQRAGALLFHRQSNWRLTFAAWVATSMLVKTDAHHRAAEKGFAMGWVSAAKERAR